MKINTKKIEDIIFDTNWCQVKIYEDDGVLYSCIKGYGKGCFWTEPEEAGLPDELDEIIQEFYNDYGTPK